MSSFFDTITNNDFIDYYSLTNSFNFNEFPKWDILTNYNQDDRVYYTNYKIYQSLQNLNIGNNPKTALTYWQLDNQDLYPFIVFDEFITKALEQAKGIIARVFSQMQDTNPIKKEAFLLLAGHYLQLLLNQRAGIDNSALTDAGMISSESANGVSVSFTQLQEHKDFFTQSLIRTIYGRQYLELYRANYIPVPDIIQVRTEFSYDNFIL